MRVIRCRKSKNMKLSIRGSQCSLISYLNESTNIKYNMFADNWDLQMYG